MIFDPTGTCRFIYSDELAAIIKKSVGKLVTRRASSVEPTQDGQWTADMSPCGGPLLGPYEDRGDALAEEVAWLQFNDIPVPRETA